MSVLIYSTSVSGQPQAIPITATLSMASEAFQGQILQPLVCTVSTNLGEPTPGPTTPNQTPSQNSVGVHVSQLTNTPLCSVQETSTKTPTSEGRKRKRREKEKDKDSKDGDSGSTPGSDKTDRPPANKNVKKINDYFKKNASQVTSPAATIPNSSLLAHSTLPANAPHSNASSAHRRSPSPPVREPSPGPTVKAHVLNASPSVCNIILQHNGNSSNSASCSTNPPILSSFSITKELNSDNSVVILSNSGHADGAGCVPHSAAVNNAAGTSTLPVSFASVHIQQIQPPQYKLVASVPLPETPPQPHLVACSKAGSNSPKSVAIQTDLTLSEITRLELNFSTSARTEKAISDRDSTIDELTRQLEELKQKLEQQTRGAEQQDKKNGKCIDMIRKLLLEKSELEKRTARQKCMENRLRLGQFVTQRQGATYTDVWVDGFAFKDLYRRQQQIISERDEIERQRKALAKRKPSSNPTSKKSKDNEMSLEDFYQADEIAKLRIAAFRREEQELATEKEKLERERNLHVRELKRITNEEASRFHPEMPSEHVALTPRPSEPGRYLPLCLLGKGGFSEVHKAFDLVELRYTALKIHQLNPTWPEEKKSNYIKHALRETQIHQSLDHARIVKVYDVFNIDNDSFGTVMEYSPGNDLDFYLKQNRIIPEREARSIMIQIVSALKYLNERKPPVIHYDLKPANILLTDGTVSGPIQITDFGLSKIMTDELFNPEAGGIELTSQGAGTYWYLPPECFEMGNGPPVISSKVDVWSLGVVFYQCLYGKKPFGNNESQRQIMENRTILQAREVVFDAKPPVSDAAKNFIKRCMTFKKDLRPDVFQLAKDPYLKPTQMRPRNTSSGALGGESSSPSSSLASSSASSVVPVAHEPGESGSLGAVPVAPTTSTASPAWPEHQPAATPTPTTPTSASRLEKQNRQRAASSTADHPVAGRSATPASPVASTAIAPSSTASITPSTTPAAAALSAASASVLMPPPAAPPPLAPVATSSTLISTPATPT